MESTIFWDITPCSPLKVSWCFRGAYGLHLQSQIISRVRNLSWNQVSSSAYPSNLKFKVTCSYETLVDSQWTTLHYIPEDSTLHNRCCENLKSYILQLSLNLYKYSWARVNKLNLPGVNEFIEFWYNQANLTYMLHFSMLSTACEFQFYWCGKVVITEETMHAYRTLMRQPFGSCPLGRPRGW
jgi:hypothetical protein